MSDIATLVLDAVSSALAKQVEADEWDVPLSLALVIVDTGGPWLMPMMLADAPDGMPVHVQLQLYAVAIDNAPPIPPMPDGVDVWGVALFTEAWGLFPSPEQAAAAQQYAEQGGSIADHPDGREVKMVTLVNRRNDRFGLTWVRGADEPQRMHSDGQMSGRVVEALARIVDATYASLARNT